MDTITASLATIPRRVAALEHMIDTLIGQVDHMNIFLNGFEDKDIPEYLLWNWENIHLYRSRDEPFGDRGDAGKFFNVQNIKGWHFICDDDILYPKDYVSSMIEKSEEHDRKYVIGCHGGDFNKFPVIDSYKCRTNMSHYKKTAVPNDYLVHFLATNSVCFHDDTITLSEDDFPEANMADIWLGLAAQTKQVGMLCREKEAGWINDCGNYDPWDSIYGHRYDKKKGNADVQTKAVNSLGSEWRHYGEC